LNHEHQLKWEIPVKIATAPVYDVSQLAERDALTKIVVENLDEARVELVSLPPEIEEMLGVLPPEVRSEVAEEWGENQRSAVLNDVRAIILDGHPPPGKSDRAVPEGKSRSTTSEIR
jgi:hypothetical protein